VRSVVRQPFELLPLFRERVWGKDSLAPYFSASSSDIQRIGEVWYTFSENLTSAGKSLRELINADPGLLGTAANSEHPELCPLLLKLIFTTERLSVQVHPNDEYARKHHGCLGKTEAWYVMDTEPPSEVAIGFREHLTPERFQDAVKSGEIEDLLHWRKVAPGDVVFTPAGTVHAIGAGLTICEIQENSDITYRLYDYGRPRELHLEHGVQVSELKPHTNNISPQPINEWRESLLNCEYFHIERLRPKAPIQIAKDQPFYLLLICTKGQGQIAGVRFNAGRAWLIPVGSDGLSIDGEGSEWILSYTAKDPLSGIFA
jgi:mannose-6-phosphate isomerase